MSSGYRRCCCGPTWPPGGGVCEDGMPLYQIPQEFGADLPPQPVSVNVIPRYLTLTLPESLDLTIFRDMNCDAPLGVVDLCTLSQPFVLASGCDLMTQKFTKLGAQCPNSAYIRAMYYPPSLRCYYHPRILWEFGWSNMLNDYEPASAGAWPVGITQPGRLYTRVLVRVPARGAGGRVRWLWFSNTKLGPSVNWPTYTAEGEGSVAEYYADRLAQAAAERNFLEGGLGLPKVLFDGDFYLYTERSGTWIPHVSDPCGCDEESVSYDPDYEAWKGRQTEATDNGCTTHCCDDRDAFWPEDPRTLYCSGSPANVGFEGFTVQAGNQTLEPAEDNVSLLYIPTGETCYAELQCADGCYVDQPSGFGTTDFLVNVLPAQIFVDLPDAITVDYRDGVCGNFDALAPNPWTRVAPATSIHGLEIDPEVAPACGANVYATYIGKPWRGVVSPLTTNWENIGLVVFGEYRPAVACEGESHGPISVQVGFIFIDPATVTQEDRRCRLFTMCTIVPKVEKLDGTQFGNAGELHSINLGPEFRYGDYATTPSVDDGDGIRRFAQFDNPWGWVPDFVFDGFRFGYLPPSSGSCDGYSFPPEAWSTSIARALSDIADVGDYCGEATGYPVCGRGDNHAYAVRVSPASGTPTPIRSLDNLRYCSTGAPCNPPGECGGMMLMMAAPPPPAELRTLDAAEMSARRELAKQKTAARQATNRATCESCPSNQWNAVGEYCEIAYKTCKCATPALKSKEKTITWQRASICPRGHFAEASQ